MTLITELPHAEQQALLAKVRGEYDGFRAQGHKLDIDARQAFARAA